MDDKIQEKLQALFVDYQKNLPNKISAMQIHWQQLCENFDSKSFQNFYEEIKNLASSASTYGLADLGEIAHELEKATHAFLNNKTISSEQQNMITHILYKLQSIAGIVGENEIATSKSTPQSKLVYVLDPDLRFVKKFENDLEQAGYQMQRIMDFAELLTALQEQIPSALVVDTDFLGEKETEALLALQENNDIAVPLFCTASSGDLLTRLHAVRAQSNAFFQKPIDTFYLTRSIDQTCGLAPEPFRVLIIDDSPSLAEYYTLILQDAGMVVERISNSLHALDSIVEFQPDLLLLDVNMPNCSGIELAAILRQEQKYMHIPIIFMSANETETKQLSGLSLGGDEFLQKPILPHHLVSAVRMCAKRAGLLSLYMTRDSLTGLLNHSHILHQLDSELAHAERQNLILTFVMIDLDHFKTVNDRFGHLIGDKVLKKLSEILTKRLRKTDHVGRYGGEEFALVLPNTKAKDAIQLIDHLREQFSKIHFSAENSEFTVTFSAGISSFPKIKTTNELIEAADKALYQAKQSGRNQVVVAN